MVDNDKLLHVLVDAKIADLKVSEKHPLVKFYRVSPGVEYQCYSCQAKAVMMADLGPSSFPCCANHDHIERAADFVWHVVTLFAKRAGYGETEEDIKRFVADNAAQTLKEMGFEKNPETESVELH